MKEQEIEELILGLDENPTESWKQLQAAYNGGVITMPADEVERRKAYKKALKAIFMANNITAESVNDSWLAGKIRRIMK